MYYHNLQLILISILSVKIVQAKEYKAEENTC